MIIKNPENSHIPALRQLWQQAFGDTDAFLDGFFSKGFSPDRCRCVVENDLPVAVLYWFDCAWQDKKLAYIYAVATDENHRGQGLCRALMENTHLHLKFSGYDGAVLVPAQPGLRELYQKIGYEVFCYVDETTVLANAPGVSFTAISPEQFEHLRKQYLPESSVLQEQETTVFLATFCDFYAGEDFVLSAAQEENTLYIQEFLGNNEKLPGIVAGFRAEKAKVRLPGSKTPFAMYHSLTENTQSPTYFGIALD